MSFSSMAAPCRRVDGVPEANDAEVGELLGDRLQPHLDVVELTCHDGAP
jgi:hypothetical protein